MSRIPARGPVVIPLRTPRRPMRRVWRVLCAVIRSITTSFRKD